MVLTKLFLSLNLDTVDAPFQTSFGTDALYLEAESWSLAVEPQFCQKQEKRTVKRQDVIYGEHKGTARVIVSNEKH